MRSAGLALLALLAAAPLPAQQRVSRDVPYVPTNQAAVEAMLRIANVGPADFLIDLGSGDGRIVVTAARTRGARGMGVDIDPDRVREAIENAREAGVADRATFARQNLFETDLRKATVITMYLLPQVNLKLRPKLLELAPGTRLVSHDFDMGDWQADLRTSVRGTGSEVYFWVVPARVAGRWQVHPARGAQAFEIELKQKYQEIDGTARSPVRPLGLSEARIDGERIQFTLSEDADFNRRVRYEGRVSGDLMEGTARRDEPGARVPFKWRAVRVN